MSTQHTPGLWFAMRSEREPEWIINQRGGPGYVCTVPIFWHRADECDANAHLIAAAPALLEVAEAFVAEFGKVSPNGTGGLYGRVQKARAAIAAARGQA